MQDQNTPMEQDELMDAADLYTLVDEEGNEKLFEMVDMMEENGQVYFALIPHIENPEELLEGEVFQAIEELSGYDPLKIDTGADLEDESEDEEDSEDE